MPSKDKTGSPLKEQIQPLIQDGDTTKSPNMFRTPELGPFNMAFSDFDDKEEATKIDSIECLKVAMWKRWIIVPILSICTAFIILLFIYWYPALRKVMLYS